MFKFLFGGKKTPEVIPESNRERFARLVSELNQMIETLPVKPRVTFDPETGHILPDTPEQFADEALALPAPEAAEAAAPEAAKPEATKPLANPAITQGDGVASAAKLTAAPSPSPSASPNPGASAGTLGARPDVRTGAN